MRFAGESLFRIQRAARLRWQRHTNFNGRFTRSQGIAKKEGENLRARRASALHAHFAEAEEHAAARRRNSKTYARAETREQQELIELMRYGGIGGAGNNPIRDDLALRVERRFQQQSARRGVTFLCDHAGHRKWRQALEPRGMNEIERQIVGHDAAERHADQNVLHEKHKNNESGEHAAGSGNGERPKNVFERHQGARPHTPRISGEGARLRGVHIHADAHREIGGRRRGFDVGKTRREALIVSELHAARGASAELLAHSQNGARRDS